MTNSYPVRRDYYRILGVLRTATLSEITSAYHVLARKCHPDIGATDPDLVAKFKLANEAYEVLSDEDKRRAYDRQHWQNARAGTSVSWSAFGIAPPFQPPSAASGTASVESPAVDDIEVTLPIAPEEALHGGPCEFTLEMPCLCEGCDGQGAVQNQVCELCRGEGRTRERRRFQITIPRLAQTGTMIRLVGRGMRKSCSRGDLLIRLRIQPYW